MTSHVKKTLLEGFEKTVEEAYLEVFLFPEDDVRENSECLQELLLQLNIEIVKLTADYIWQKDELCLKINGLEGYFYATLDYDACVDDEWFAVYIVQQLTKNFPVIARLIDQDGEFLLIEASDYLPKWAESDEICEKRVYMSKGRIHLIGRIEAEGKLIVRAKSDEQISISKALDVIRRYPEQTLAKKEIQKAIEKRIGDQPAKVKSNFHHVTVHLPPKAKWIFQAQPSIIATVVRAYHSKDSIDMKRARNMSTFLPFQSLKKHRIRFTRILYAMISATDFYPDSKLKWDIPHKNSKNFKAFSLAAKLTLGLEILLQRSNTSTTSSTEKEQLDMPSAMWPQFQSRLKSYNYYRDLIEGSKEYSELETKAKSYFHSMSSIEDNSSSDIRTAEEIRSLLKEFEDNTDELSEECSLPDDDESWMEINMEDLDSLLESQLSSKVAEHKLDQIPEKLKEFMSKMSDFAGVENQPRNGEEVGEDDEEGLDPLDFQADDFVSAMDQLLLELGKPNEEFTITSDEDEDDLMDLKKQENLKHQSKFLEYMNQMDKELESTEVGKTFKMNTSSGQTQQSSTSETSYEPLDIDMNALSNILESYQSQEDQAGPASNLLRNIGFDISKATK